MKRKRKKSKEEHRDKINSRIERKNHYNNISNVAVIDPDIDVESINSPTIKSLLKCYSSITEKGDQSVIHFWIGDYAFLSMDDTPVPFPACYENTQKFADMEETMLFVPVIKTLYVTPFQRNSGLQTRVLNNIINLANNNNEIILSFASPFKLRDEWKIKTNRDAFVSFYKDGELPADDFDNALETQKARLQKLGMLNVSWEWHECSRPGSAHVILPDGVEDKYRRIVETRLIS